MRRYRSTELSPWIERLIESYGSGQQERSARAHVVGVSDLADSLRLDESDACVLFLSDGAVFIPAVLSASAWERMQDLEEMETFSGLDNTTVSVQHIQLNFHMDAELTSCQFYLSVNQIATVGRVTRHYHPPSCTTLQSVKQQILKTWRSQMKESSLNSVNSQSGVALSFLMGAWHNDIIMDLLNDAMERLTTPTTCHPSIATPTRWHRERLHFRGEECFSAPVSHLLIPEEQRELLTADPGASSETQSGLVLPLADVTVIQPIGAEDEDRDSPTTAYDRMMDSDHPTLDHTRPEVWSGGGEECREGVSPWDMFCPASYMLGTPSSSLETSIEPLLQEDSQSLMTGAPQLLVATSTQTQPTAPNKGWRSECSIMPYQEPRPSLPCSTHSSDKTTTKATQEEEQQVLSPPTWIVQNTAQENSPKLPPSKKSPPVSPPAKKERVHSDGNRFSYTYKPCTLVMSALSHYEVPEQLVQWAVGYLGIHQQALGVSSGGADAATTDERR